MDHSGNLASPCRGRATPTTVKAPQAHTTSKVSDALKDLRVTHLSLCPTLRYPDDSGEPAAIGWSGGDPAAPDN